MSTTRLGRAALRVSANGRWGAYRPIVRDVTAGPVALMLLVLMIVKVLHGPGSAFDFRFAYWPAGHLVLDGHSPYIWTAAQYRSGHAFVYPALSALVFAFLSLLPVGLGAVLFTFVCIALVPLALRTLGVSDWRVYGIALIWEPVYYGWITANESLFLMLGLACLWRCRGRPLAAGLLAAALISLKPLMWPLALWLLVTRRWAAAAYALGGGLLINLAAWWVLGIHQIEPFLRASRRSIDLQWQRGEGIPALLWHFGANRTLGLAVMLIASLLLVAAVARSGLVRRDETLALTLAVALVFVASPLVWSHYFVLLVVPMAIAWPRWKWVWACPLLLWLCSEPADWLHTWQEIGAWIICIVMLAAVAREAKATPAVPGAAL